MIVAGLVGALMAAVVTVIALNFITGEKQVQRKLEHRYAIDDAQFRRELGALLGPPIIDGNRVTNFENGIEIFPAMLQAVRAARHNVNFETYIYWSGDVGREFAEALSERARAGIEVHVLIDWVGSQRMEQGLLDKMTDAGVQVERYHPLHWYQLARMNNRTHRKLLVVDGEVGFTGGVGIADNWSGDATSPDHWRDSHYRLQGPAVAQMQAAFMDNWIKTTGTVLQGKEYFPELPAVGDARAQVFTSSPSSGGDSMLLMYLLSITAAVHTIDLSAAYFVPDDLTRQSIRAALERGVRVRIIVPGGHIDTEVVRKASRAQWGELLAAGAEIHEFQPTMFHCKMLIVDQLMVSVGSTNFDNRSFRLNDEANLNVYDAKFAARATTVFEQDLKRARRITYEEWEARPWQERILEHASALLSSQL
ncbi:MAG: cardiolipin synthase B [Proteobacteria bacterium]|nr:cardiolipin synthase B [Pseudomonadota bacterium]